jgi:putative peptide zinc metalloprotease protein
VGSKVREIACPECLRKRLRVFRVDKAGLRSYLVTDPLQNRTYEFEPWQFYVLEVLTECESFARLSLVVEERFGQPITQEDLDKLFVPLVDKKLFSVSLLATPLLADFSRRRPGLRTESAQNTPDLSVPPGRTDLPSEVRDALGLDKRTQTKGRDLFDPTRLLQITHPLFAPFRRLVFVIPLLLIPALFVAFRHHQQFTDDLFRWFGRLSIVWHALFGLVTVNLLSTFVSALIAYNYGITVSAFCVVFYFVVWPRFIVRVGSLQELPRRERIWYYAAPVLLRLALFSVAMLVWFNTRRLEGFPARFSVALAVITQISILLAVIPLRESNGYWLLATLLDEPKLREKAANTLVNRLRGHTNKSLDDNSLVVYALACSLFMVAVIAVFLLLLGRYLESRLTGGIGVLVLAVVAAILSVRITSKLKKVNLANARATKFTAWRDREAPKVD